MKLALFVALLGSALGVALVPGPAPAQPKQDDAWQASVNKAVAYLKGIQWTENAAGPGPKGERIADKSHIWYGGFGYSRRSRRGV